jgi:hypothetical protein
MSDDEIASLLSGLDCLPTADRIAMVRGFIREHQARILIDVVAGLPPKADYLVLKVALGLGERSGREMARSSGFSHTGFQKRVRRLRAAIGCHSQQGRDL